MTKAVALIKENATVHSLTAGSRLSYCDSCFNIRKALNACAGCSQMLYCSRICQKRMWKFHKPECHLYRKFGRLPTTEIRLLIRLMLIQDPEMRKEIDSFVSHREYFGQDMSFLSYYRGIINVLSEHLVGWLHLSEMEILTLLCQIKINAFHILDESGSVIALGIFLKSARLDHSCMANAEYVFDGKEIAIIPFVEDLSVDKARISYIDSMTTTAHRRAQLSSCYFFNCDCTLCCNESRDGCIGQLICCGQQPLSPPTPLDQLEGNLKHLTASSSGSLAQQCLSCRTLYDDHTVKSLSEFCLSFYDKRLNPEDARNAIIIYCRMRGISEISGNSVSADGPCADGSLDSSALAYYLLFGHVDSVYLANVCRAALSGASIEGVDFLLGSLRNATACHSSQLLERRTLLKVMVACGIDLVSWQQKHLDFKHFDIGMNACSLAGFISRNASDADSVCTRLMEEIRAISVFRPVEPNLACLFARLVAIAENKLNPFAAHHSGIKNLLVTLKNNLKSP